MFLENKVSTKWINGFLKCEGIGVGDGLRTDFSHFIVEIPFRVPRLFKEGRILYHCTEHFSKLKCGIKLLIHSQSSTVAALKFGDTKVTSSHA